MADLFDPRYQAVDANGLPYSGALLYFYQAGTTTPITTYQDAGAVTPHASPVVADSSGTFAAIFLNTTDDYKVVLKTAAGVTVSTVDNIAPVTQADVVGPASAVDGRIAAFDGTTGKLLKALTPANARLAAEMHTDYFISGLKPDKISTNVLRLYPGVVGSSDGTLMVRTTANYDIDMSTTGAGGLDTGSPVGGLDYFVYVLRNNATGAFAAVISNSITYGGVTLPSGYSHVRKLRFGFVYNVSWDGIPNHDAANWPWPLIRLTGSEGSSVWRALNAGTSATNAEVACGGWIPDNCRIAMIMVRVTCGASAGTGYITSSGAGHTNGIEFTGIANSTYTAYVPAIRVDSLRKLLYKVTGDVALSIFVLGYYATEPS